MKTCEEIYKMCKIEKNAKPKLETFSYLTTHLVSAFPPGGWALYTLKSPREKKTSRAELMARTSGRGK